MADDIQSNIRINVDTTSAMDSIRLLQNQISAFHQQMSKMGAASVADSRNMQQNLINSINSTGQFAANITKIKTTAEQFSYSLEKNKLSMGEYFRYAGGATKSFGRLFSAEFETINKVARERVKDLQTQYIKLGRDANGAMQAIKVRPLVLDMDNLATRTQIAAQRQQLLNQLLKQGSTNLLNFGKNTQWAGRQLMVGFTIPLTIMGGAAMKAYKQIEEASLRLRRVYGDFDTTIEETNKMVKQVQQLALEYTKYGIAVKDSMEIAATAAATGKKGNDLLAQISSANRLSVLGGIEQQKALETTISLTDAFSISAKNLGENINFLNAVENQTVLSIDDLTTAIPKAAPVIQQLGGDVKDLAFFMTAMKEGGINASEGANAIKSGLASIINPTNTATKMLQGFGINLRAIVNDNKGDVKKTVVDFAKALDTLDPINRAKAIEQLFGKFQFARMSTLFKNVIEQGSQASQVLNLANQSSLELSMLAQRELGKIEQSPLYKFQKAIADFQAQMAPVGEQFMKAVTPIINFGADVLKQFNNLGEGVKGFIVQFVAVAGVVGPVLLMSFGLIANAVANVIKGFALVKDIFNKTGKSSMSLGDQVSYMTNEQIQAAAIASSLDQVHSKLRQTFTSEAAAVDLLTGAYQRSVAAQAAFSVPITPRGAVPGGAAVRKYAVGGFVSGPGTGTSDSIPALLSNGEAVIPAKSVSKNKDLVQSLINDALPRFAEGGIVGTPSENLLKQINGTKAVIAYGAHQPFTSAHQGIAQMGMDMSQQSGIPFFQFTSNQGKAKRSVLGDDLKSRMISEAIGRNPEFAKNPFELMAILAKAGIKDVNILLGEDRMKSPVWEAAAKEFGITITKTGIPRPTGSVSGTMARAAAASGNLGMFESLLASGMSKSTKEEIFKSLFAAGSSKIKKFAFGGMVRGPGGPTDDLVPANLSNGEAVIDAATTRKNPRIISALFAGKKIVIPGYQDNNSETFDFDAYERTHVPFEFEIPKGTTAGNSKKIREVLYAASLIGDDVLDALKQSLENAPKMTGKSLDVILKSPQFELLNSLTTTKANTENPEGRSTGSQGMVKAHATASRPMTAAEVAPFMGPSWNAKLQDATAINALTNLTFPVPAPFNKGSITTTGSEWSSFITGNYDDFMSQLAGQGLDTNDPAARAFADNVARQMEQAGAQAVGDSEFEQIVSRALAEEIDAVGKNVSRGVKQTFDEARRYGTLQVTLPGQQTRRIDIENKGVTASGITSIPIHQTGYRNIDLIDGAHQRADIPTQQKIRDRVTRLGAVTASAFQEVTRRVLGKPENDLAMVSRDAQRRNSPHQQVSIDGKDDGVAYSQARTNAIAAEEAKAATKRSRRVSSGGIITPGESQAQQVQRARGGRVRTEGESFLPENMVVFNPNNLPNRGMDNAVTDPSELMTGRKLSFREKMQMLSKPQYVANKIQRTAQPALADSIRNKSFGASGAMAVGSMVLPGQMGQMMGMASMLTSFAGMGAGGIANGLKSLNTSTIGLGLKFIKLVPYVGAAVMAFEAFDTFVMPLIRKNSKAYEAIADTLSITQEKLDKINSFFGTELKLTGVRSTIIASGDQNKKEASIAQQFQQSQEFKDLYQESAKEMQKLSDVEFKRAMQAMAADLFGQGLEEEGVTAILDAIAIEAKKTRVSIAPELFSLDTPEAKAQMEKNLKNAFGEVSKASKGISPEGTLNPEGRTVSAATGEFDNFYLTPVDPESIAKIKAGTEQIASYMSALSGQFANGEISAKEFNIEYSKLISMSNQQTGTSGIEAMKAAMISLNSEIGNAIKGLSEMQFGVWQKAILAGVTPTKEALDAAYYGTQEVIDAYTKNFADATKQIQANDAKRTSLTKQIRGLQDSSTDIANTEQKINDKYDKRISQLEKIKTLNDQLANSQKGQLTLAEALNKGDIAAAARAAVDIQNQDIQNSLDNQQQGLEDARKSEVGALRGQQAANTAALKDLTRQVEDLNTKGVVVKNPENVETGPALQSQQGNDPLGYLNYAGGIARDATPAGLFQNIFSFFSNPAGFLKNKAQQYLLPGTAVTQDGRIVPQRPTTPPPSTNANGGFITGPGTGTSDDIPAMLSNGEYVIRANAVKKIGVNTLDKLNQADRLGFAAGGMVGYKDGGYTGGRQVRETYRAYTQRQAAIQAAAIKQIKDKAERDKLYKQGGFQGFEAGANSFGADLMKGPMGGFFKAMGETIEENPEVNFLLSTLSLPVNLIGGAVRGSMNAGRAMAKGDLLGAATAHFRGFGDAFASTYGNMFDKENVYKSQFEVAAQEVIDNGEFGSKNNKELQSLARIIGGGGNLAFDPVSYTGLGLAAKASKLGTVAKNIKTSLGVRGARNSLKAAAVSTGADVSQVGKLTPALAFNLSDEALAGVIKDNFYGNMRVPGMRSSTKDSLENRIAVEQSMMGISPNAPASKTPAYGFLTTREDVPSYYNSEMGGQGPRSAAQQAIDDFNLLINPNSRYTSFYGSNTIKLKPDALGRATVSMGDSLSIWDRATRLGQRVPGVDKLSSIFSTFPAMSGKLGSTQNLLKTEIRGISTPTRFPYIEAHLPGGFTLDDIESIILNPSRRYGPQDAVKIAEDLAQRKAALEAMLESMGIKGIKVTENEGIKIGDKALDALKAQTPEGKWVQASTAEYPLPSKKAPGSIAAAVLPPAKKEFKGVITGEEIMAAIMKEFDETFPMLSAVRIPTVGKVEFPNGQMPADYLQYLKILTENGGGYDYVKNLDAKTMWDFANQKMQLKVYNNLLDSNPDAVKGMSFEKYLEELKNTEPGTSGDAAVVERVYGGNFNLSQAANEAFVKTIMGIDSPKDYLYEIYRNTREFAAGEALSAEGVTDMAKNIAGYHSLDRRMAHGFHAAGSGDGLSRGGSSIIGQYELDDLFGPFGTSAAKNLVDEFPILVGPKATQRAIDRKTMVTDIRKLMPNIPSWINVSKSGVGGTGPFSRFEKLNRFNFNAIDALPASTWKELKSALGITTEDFANMYKTIFPQNNMPVLDGGLSAEYLRKALNAVVPLDKFGMPGKAGFDFSAVDSGAMDEVIRQMMVLQRFLPEKLITDRFFPNKYAKGGFVMPSPEPAPTQFAKGGMVYAANGGMLMNGKMYGGFANGGMVLKKFAEGGYSMGTDTVPAMLTPGEFVIKKSAVDRIGVSTLSKINGYANGGLVGGVSAVSGDSVYNSNTYEINVNVSSNSNPDQIANAVMTKIRQIDNKRVRGSAF